MVYVGYYEYPEYVQYGHTNCADNIHYLCEQKDCSKGKLMKAYFLLRNE